MKGDWVAIISTQDEVRVGSGKKEDANEGGQLPNLWNE